MVEYGRAKEDAIETMKRFKEGERTHSYKPWEEAVKELNELAEKEGFDKIEKEDLDD